MESNFTLDHLRKELVGVDLLMRRGIFTDHDTGKAYFTGYSYKTLYDWDQYFESIVQIYMGWSSDYIKNGVTIFLDHQLEDGHIARSVPGNEFHDPEHVKPFLSQIAMLVYKAYGAVDWILEDNYLSRLRRYLDYWLSEMDGNQNGLSEWMSAPHTGMDNQHERCGWWLDRFSEGVDLNCYLVRECRAFAILAELKGERETAQIYRQKADHVAERIRALCWDEEEGFFFDHNARFGEAIMSRHAGWASSINSNPEELVKVKSVSAFTTLWAGVATQEQARRMIYEHLFNPREFWTPYPLATLAKSERWYSQDWLPGDLGCNWRAKVWIPTNYMVYHGLRRYGYDQFATLLGHETFQLVKKSGNREYYDAENGEGCGLDPFWGWSLLGYFMPYEDSLDEVVCWID
jgi:putative isomerase